MILASSYAKQINDVEISCEIEDSDQIYITENDCSDLNGREFPNDDNEDVEKVQQIEPTIASEHITKDNIRKNSRVRTKRDEPETLAQDELIRNWCNMECTKCTEKFCVFPEVKVHYHNVHQSNGYLVCCNKKFFRRIRILEHIARHMNPDVFA